MLSGPNEDVPTRDWIGGLPAPNTAAVRPQTSTAAFRFPRGIAELCKQRAEIIEGKVRVVSASRELVEQFVGLTHAPPSLIGQH
jgi:hypothetical protein